MWKRSFRAIIPWNSNAIELRRQAPQIVAICSSKTGSRRQSRKTSILKRFLKGIVKGKMNIAKIEKFCCQNTIRNFHAAYNAIYNFELQNTKVVRMQLPQRRTLTQPLHCNPQTMRCKTQQNYAVRIATEQQKSQFYYSVGRSMRTILRKKQCRTTAEQQKSQFYYSFGRSMRTILRKTQCIMQTTRRPPEIAILLQFRAIHAHYPT